MGRSSSSKGFLSRLIRKGLRSQSTPKPKKPRPKSRIRSSRHGKRQRRQWNGGAAKGVSVKDLRDIRKYNYTVSTAIDAVIADGCKEGWEWVPSDKELEPSEDQTVKKDLADKLLKRPNPQMTGKDLLKAVREDIEVTGDAFIEVVWENLISTETGLVVGRRPYQLWPVSDGEVFIRDDNKGLLPDPKTREAAYEQKLNGEIVANWLADEMIHISGSSGRRYGTPKLLSVILLLCTQQEALKYNYATFSGQKIPKQIVSLDTSVEELERMLDEQEEEADENPQLVQYMAGGKGATVLKLMDSMRDMEFLNLIKYLERSILARWRIAPVAIGISEAGGAGIVVGKTQSSKYWDMIEEGSEQISESLSMWASEAYGFEEYIMKILSAREDEDEAQARIDDVRIKGNVLTINEVRAQMGLKPVEWGNDPFTPMGQQAAPTTFSLSPHEGAAAYGSRDQGSGEASPGSTPSTKAVSAARQDHGEIIQTDPAEQKITEAMAGKLVGIFLRMRKELLKLVQRPDIIIAPGQTSTKATGITQEQLLAEARVITAKYATEMNQVSKEQLLDAYLTGKSGAAMDLQTSLKVGNKDLQELQRLQEAYAHTNIVTFSEDQVAVIEQSLAEVKDAPDLYTFRTLVEQKMGENLWKEQYKLDRIARTSINRTSNHAKGTLYREIAGETDPQVTWITAMDLRVRPSHRILHGKTMKLSEALAILDQDINCRCRILRTQKDLPEGVPKAEDLVRDIQAERERANELARQTYLHTEGAA